MERFEKQPYEEFTVAADFNKNFETGETITSQTVTAVDENDVDVSTTVIDQGTVTNDGAGKVTALVRAGVENDSPYKLTFRCTTSNNHKWELDVEMKVVER